MSLLNNQNPVISNRAILLAQKAEEIKYAPAKIVEILYTYWERGFDALWNTDQFTAQEKLETIGTDAKELFELNSLLTQFMVVQLSGKRDDIVNQINEKVASIPPYTINQDGTVTLN